MGVTVTEQKNFLKTLFSDGQSSDGNKAQGGGGVTDLMARPLKDNFFCGFPKHVTLSYFHLYLQILHLKLIKLNRINVMQGMSSF